MMETLKKGMSNPSVLVAKYLLHYCGIKEATEEFDATFVNFVKEYQKENNLMVDGVIGARTWKRIAAHLPVTSRTKNRKSVETCALQALFNLEIVGIFGAKTKTAVQDYQNQHNLKSDGVVGAVTWGSLLCSDVTADGNDINHNAIQPINFKQYDSRWGSKMYSNHGDKKQTMKSSACGPTSMADIVHQWWDNKITPYDLALKSLEWGCRTYDSGTNSSFFKKIATEYKASKYSTTTNIDNAIKCLNEGGYVIVCFGPGTKGKPWYQLHTKGGHYCCLWKWDGTYFYINDPASDKAARAKSSYDDVKDCRKGFYCFWR